MPRMARTGRRSKLTPEVEKKIIQALKDGNYFAVACKLAGISPQTGHEWIARGRGTDKTRKSSKTFADFANAVKNAEAAAEDKAVRKIVAAGTETWQAAAWYLERKFPDRWARRERPSPDLDFGKMSDEQLERIAEGEDPAVVLSGESSSTVGIEKAETASPLTQ